MAYVHSATGLCFLANPRTASRATAKALVQTHGFNVDNGHHGRPLKKYPRDLTTFCVVRDLPSTLASWSRRAGMPVDKFVAHGFMGQKHIIKAWPDHTLFPFEAESNYVLRYEDGNMDTVISDFLARFNLGPVALERIR